MTARDIAQAILDGDADDDIGRVIEAINDRRRFLGAQARSQFRVGDRVRVVNARRYSGEEGVVTKRNQKTIDVKLDSGTFLRVNMSETLHEAIYYRNQTLLGERIVRLDNNAKVRVTIRRGNSDDYSEAYAAVRTGLGTWEVLLHVPVVELPIHARSYVEGTRDEHVGKERHGGRTWKQDMVSSLDDVVTRAARVVG